jgi:hypothetical protein
VSIAVQLEPADNAPPAVEYRWDADTDILSARLTVAGEAVGLTGSVELQGDDGSWLILDVVDGRITGIEVAVWPDVHKTPRLAPPPSVVDASVVVPLPTPRAGAATLELELSLRAESDDDERVIYFCFDVRRDGLGGRTVRTVRFGRDLLLDVDPESRIVGLWLLNVPPFPVI